MPKRTRLQEKDPNGTDQHAPGAKMDDGKLLAGLVLGDFAHALQDICAVGTYGANKYTDSGWTQVPDGINRYKNAMCRHLLASNYELNDPESGLPHLHHAGWNILAMMELQERSKG